MLLSIFFLLLNPWNFLLFIYVKCLVNILFFLHYFSLHQRQWTQLYTLIRRSHFNWEIITDNFCIFQMKWHGFPHFQSVDLINYKYDDLHFYQFLDLELLITLSHDKRIRTSFPHQTFKNIFSTFSSMSILFTLKEHHMFLELHSLRKWFTPPTYQLKLLALNCTLGNGRICISLMTNYKDGCSIWIRCLPTH